MHEDGGSAGTPSVRPNRARRREDSGPLPGPGSRKGWRCASLPADPRSLTVESLSGEREMKVRLFFAFSGSGGTLLGSTRCLCCLAVQRAAAAGTFPLRLGLRVDSSGLSCLLRATLSPGRCPNAFLVRKMADTPRAAGHDGAGYGIRLVLACWARTTGGRVIASVPANMTWLVVCKLSLSLSLSLSFSLSLPLPSQRLSRAPGNLHNQRNAWRLGVCGFSCAPSAAHDV